MSALWAGNPPVGDDAVTPRVVSKPYRAMGWFVTVRMTLDAPMELVHLVRAVSAYPFESSEIARKAGATLATLCEAYCTGVNWEYNISTTP